MSRFTLSSLVLLGFTFSSLACDGEKGEATSDSGATESSSGGDEGGDDDGGTDDAPCPDEVPEEYRYLWDCSAATCDGGVFAVHLGTGTTSEAGVLSTTEQWFLFTSEDDYCIEEFTLGGPASAYDPASFKCSSCEEIYDVEWEMTSDNACGLAWGSIFIEDSDEVEGPFSGFLMFDTHNAFGDRHEDNEILVLSAPTSGGYYYVDFNYGRGTAEPLSEVDGPPAQYDWVSNGACWSISRDAPGPGEIFKPPVATPLSEF